MGTKRTTQMLRVRMATGELIDVADVPTAQRLLATERDISGIGATVYYEAHAGLVYEGASAIEGIAYNGSLESEGRQEWRRYERRLTEAEKNRIAKAVPMVVASALAHPDASLPGIVKGYAIRNRVMNAECCKEIERLAREELRVDIDALTKEVR